MKRIMWLSLVLGLCLGSVRGQNLVPFRQGDLWGFSDFTGKIIIEPAWDEVEPFEYGHALVRLGDKWGVINPQGKLIIKPYFDTFSYLTWRSDSGNFRMAYLHSGDSIFKGIVNVSTGEICVAPEYFSVDYHHRNTAPFSARRKGGSTILLTYKGIALPYSGIYTNKEIVPGVFLCSESGLYGACRADGSLFLPIEYDSIYPVSEGMILVQKKGMRSYLKSNGTMAFPMEFRWATSFRGGSAIACPDSLCGIMKKNGKWQKEPFSPGASRNNALGYFAFVEKGKVGIMGPDGKVVLPPLYDNADVNPNGTFFLYNIVDAAYRVGLASPSGKLIIEPMFNSCSAFNAQGLSITLKEGKKGIIDSLGRVLSPAKYDEIYAFHPKGVAFFKSGTQYGLLDLHGKDLSPAIFDMVESFDGNNLSISTIGGKKGLLSISGESVLPNEYQEIIRIHNYYSARKDGRYYLLDAGAKLVLETAEASIEDVSPAGLVVTKLNGKYGIRNLKGKILADHNILEYSLVDSVGISFSQPGEGFRFMNAKDYSVSTQHYKTISGEHYGKLLKVVDANSKHGFIDLGGRELIRPQFKFTAAGDKYFYIQDEGHIGFIDFEGNWIIPMKYDYHFASSINLDEGICKVAKGDMLFYIDSTGREYYIPASAPAQPPANFKPQQQRGVQSLSMTSSSGRSYQILIGLPDNYYISNKRYPVIYLTDADFLMGSVWEMMNMLSKTYEIPEFIIIGIAYGSDFNTWYSRRIDEFCPTRQSYTLFKGGGESLNFEAFLEKELISMVDSTFRTIPEFSTFVGYSFGGLFGASLLMRKPDLFRDYILISPSIWWDNDLVLKQAEKEIPQGAIHDGRVFISLGSLESSTMKSQEFYKLLLKKDLQGLLPEYHTLPDQTHNSTFHPALIKALKSMYGL